MPYKDIQQKRENDRAYRLAHIAERRGYRLTHKEELAAYQKVYDADRRDGRAPYMRAKAADFSTTLRGHWAQLKSSGRKRNIEVSIPFEDYRILRALPCYYCGGALPNKGHGMDRRDNALGYLQANCLPCCFTCNVTKNAYLSYGEMCLISVLRQPVLYGA